MSLPRHIKEAIEKYVPTMDGGDWAALERRCEVAELVYEHKPKVVVEIGTFGGAGAVPIAFALRENNNGGKLYCLDPWRIQYAIEGEWSANSDWYSNKVDLNLVHQKCMDALWAHNLDEWVVVIRAASQHAFKLFPSIDILIIDANHSEEASLRDARLYAPNVVKKGWVLADDCDWVIKQGDTMVQSTAKMMAFIEQSCDLQKQSGNMRFYKKR